MGREYTFTNDFLQVTVSTVGGELQSVCSVPGGTEYLWQGDGAFWGRRALNLFPLAGRVYQKRYTLHGVAYTMPLHGFLPHADMELWACAADGCVLRLCDSPETREIYPYAFTFLLRYQLRGDTLHITFRVENHSAQTLYCGMGGHPGFCLPLEDGLCFEDYCLTFPQRCAPRLVELTDDVLCTGAATPYPLRGGDTLPLRHQLFVRDAIVLSGVPRSVTLHAPKGKRGVTVAFPQMPYVGFWHKPNSQAPFVCIEPWLNLPGRENTVEELSRMEQLAAVEPGAAYENPWSIRFF